MNGSTLTRSLMKNVMAIDVGHGHVKSVHRVGDSALVYNKFPSLTLQVSGAHSASSSMAASLKLVQVEADGMQFRVGPDIELAVPIGIDRNRDDNYSTTPSYLALVRGALHAAKLETIDVLVVGLPMTTLSTNSANLKTRLKGTHRLPAFNAVDAAAGLTVNVQVKEVVVLAQAVGALSAACEQDPSLMTQRILTLDYGFHTLDILASHGMRPFPERLGAIPGGVASYIDRLQSSVAAQIRKDKPHLSGEFSVPSSLYEEALMSSPQVVKLGPGNYDLANHRQEADALLIQTLGKAIAKIQTANDLTAIALAGGGADILARVVGSQFPAVSTVVKLNDSQFAIARGFHLFGEAFARKSGN